MAEVDIVVPVYRGLAETKACLSSVLASNLSDEYSIQVIYDAGQDAEIECYLEGLSIGGQISLHKNSANLGFVVTVNRGFSLHPERDVIILNSDTVVPVGWAQRLRDVAMRCDSIATVTPFSNNGEICSFPRICHINDIPPELSVDWIDGFFYREGAGAEIVLPTGVGFCMYITRRALRAVGGFDEEAFGRGYGEENDFCRKAVAKGLKNLLCQNLFVYHAGGVSFGEEKVARIANALKIIDRRYPNYAGEVNKFIAADPARLLRARVMAKMLSEDRRRMVLHVSHNMGGGTRRYVEEIASVSQASTVFLMLEPVSAMTCRVGFPEWMGESLLLDVSQGLDGLVAVLREINISGVVISHVKGFETTILPLIEALAVPVWTLLHDFYFLAGNPTLTQKNGCYPLELSSASVFDEQRADQFSDLGKERWRRLVHPILYRSEMIIAPSSSVRDIYQRFMPDLKIEVHPHPDFEQAFPYPAVSISQHVTGAKRVVSIGALGKEKGADLLEAVADLAASKGLDIEFHLLGYAYRPLSDAVITHGVYEDRELSSLLRGVAPDLVWYPCQWPETYSYTLSAVLEAGLPLLVPALGALADRCDGRPATKIAAYPDSPAGWLEKIQVQLSSHDSLPASIPWGDQLRCEKFYSRAPWTQMLVGVDREAFDCALIMEHLAPRSNGQLMSERIVALLFRFRAVPIVRHIMQLVPLTYQRKIKRWLSKKPLHELAAQTVSGNDSTLRRLKSPWLRFSKLVGRDKY